MDTLVKITPPADVPKDAQQAYIQNYLAITKNTGRLMLFACDQKIEHLNNDFYGEGIHPDAMQPEHLFNIAHKGNVGAMAAHLGLVARYGKLYPSINYIIKLNGKSDLASHQDPWSHQLWSVEDVLRFRDASGLNVCGIGYTIYLGSEFEGYMLEKASQAIYQAHQHGLITILWAYIRGKNINDDQNAELVAGAAGVAAALGSDFVKVKPPHQALALRIATLAAGNTKIICSGGSIQSPQEFLQELYAQLKSGGAAGSATGRNIFQRSLPEAVALCAAINALVVDQQNNETAFKKYEEIKNL